VGEARVNSWLSSWRRVAILYAALFALVYLPVVAFGRTLAPEAYQPWGVTRQGAWQRSGRTAVNTFNVDLGTPGYYEAPVNRLVGAMLRRGEAPLWNPYQGLGAPLATQFSSRALFPYQWLEDVAPPTWADLFLLGRLWVAAMLTFGFLRRLTVLAEGAFLGGALYALSGSMVWFLNLEQMTNVSMVMPGFLWACEALAKDSRPRDVAAAGVATAMVLLAGQPETALYVLALGALWTVFRAWRLERIKPALLAGVGGALLGAMLSSPLLLPFADFERASAHIHSPERIRSLPATPLSYVVALFTPSVTERPVVPAAVPVVGQWDILGGYTGVTLLVILLAVLPRWRFKHRPEALFLAGSAAFIVLKNFGAWPFTLLGRVPLFEIVFSNRWAGPVWCFAAACAAALCADALAAPDENATTPWTPSTPWLPKALQTSAIVVLALLYLRGFFGIERLWTSMDRVVVRTELTRADYALASRTVGFLVTASALAASVMLLRRPRAGASLVWALGAVSLAELWFAVPQGLSPMWSVARVIAPALCLAAAWPLSRNNLRLAAVAAGLALVASATVDLTAPRGLPSRNDPYRTPPYVTWLRAHVGHGRVMGVGGALVPNQASAFGLRDVRYILALALPEPLYGSLALLQWHPTTESTMLWFTGGPTNFYASPPSFGAALARLRGYDLMGVRYFITPPDANHGTGPLPDGLTRVYHGEVDLYERRDALPRAWVVHTFERAPADPTQQFARLADTTFDPRVRAMVSGDAPADTAPTSPSTTTFERDDAHVVTLRVRASAPGMLVLSDAWYQSWEATVDGTVTPIARVNSFMRGVPVGAGEHRVEFRYRDEAFKLGETLAALGILCVAGLAAMGAWPSSKRRDASV
jgi:hypothetical protein